MSLYAQLSALARQLEDQAPAKDALGTAAAVSAALQAMASDKMKAANDAVTIAVGVKAALAVIELGPAIKALETVSELAKVPAGAGVGAPTAAFCGRVAHERVLAASALALKLPATEAAKPVAHVPPPPMTAGARPAPEVLRNIATYHREHERFYTFYEMKEALDICGESNRLKTVATVWIDEAPLAALSGDFADPRFQAVGCVDLNALRAIAGIGVLFMEGEQEPAEIRRIKANLAYLAQEWTRSGAWLAEKMQTAWARESILLRDDAIHAAEPRFATIATNWRGARHAELSGKCLGLALEILSALDLSPAGVRARRRESGRRLLDAAWVMDQAVQVTGRRACDLGENEMRWTRYLELTQPVEA